MMYPCNRSIYTFKGHWFDVFEAIAQQMRPGTDQKFSVWVSKKSNSRLLILYNMQLSADVAALHDVEPLGESDFIFIFQNNVQHYWIHGFKELKEKAADAAPSSDMINFPYPYSISA